MPQFSSAASWQCAPLADRNWHATSTPIPDRSRTQAQTLSSPALSRVHPHRFHGERDFICL